MTAARFYVWLWLVRDLTVKQLWEEELLLLLSARLVNPVVKLQNTNSDHWSPLWNILIDTYLLNKSNKCVKIPIPIRPILWPLTGLHYKTNCLVYFCYIQSNPDEALALASIASTIMHPYVSQPVSQGFYQVVAMYSCFCQRRGELLCNCLNIEPLQSLSHGRDGLRFPGW